MQEIKIEPDDYNGVLVGRIYVNGIRTSAYIEYNSETEPLFSAEQISILNNQFF